MPTTSHPLNTCKAWSAAGAHARPGAPASRPTCPAALLLQDDHGESHGGHGEESESEDDDGEDADDGNRGPATTVTASTSNCALSVGSATYSFAACASVGSLKLFWTVLPATNQLALGITGTSSGEVGLACMSAD